MNWSLLEQLSNEALLNETKRLAASERHATVALIAAIAEVDNRCLYLGEGCPSMFVYCTRVLHLSEHAAYDRIQVARLSGRFPLVLEVLERGSVTLTNLRLLAPHLTSSNVNSLLADATRKTRLQVEEMIAHLRPRPPVPSIIRQLPDTTPAPIPAAGGEHLLNDLTASGKGEAAPDSVKSIGAPPTWMRPAVIEPLAPGLYKVQFTLSGETHEKLRRVRDLIRHKIPTADVAVIFDLALSRLLTDLEKRRTGTVTRPRTVPPRRVDSRHIPASVKRDVWKRDAGRCAFVGSQGRCTETAFLEFHHVKPYAAGGKATAENIQLRCRPHNAYEAELFFGDSAPSFVREAPLTWPVETGPGTSSSA